MEIVRDLRTFVPDRKMALSIGKFDGVHRGHQKILREVVKRREQGLLPAVFTFDPAPEVFFARRRGISPLGVLSTRREKEALLEQMGIEVLIEYPFNETTSGTDAVSFVRDILAGQLKVGYIAAGPDVSFGAGGKGNVDVLQSLGAECGFGVELISKELFEGHEISSTLIREYLQLGEIEKASACLGRAYGISGEVVHGHALGRTIHIPTINILPEEEKLLPPFGVYATRTLVGERTFYGISNLGRKPTISDREALTLETNLFGFSGDLYGKELNVELLHFCRPERHFASFEELGAQMRRDLEEVRALSESMGKG